MTTTPLVPRPSADPATPRWQETLRDGTHVIVRPLDRRDASAERDFIASLSPESRRFRFLGSVQSPSERLIQQLVGADQVHDVAFAAIVPEDAHERILGVGRYSTDAEGRTCECAVAVADAWQGRGLGAALMRHLIEVARARGIRVMESIDSSENVAMRDLAHHLGFRSTIDPQDARQVIHRLDLQAAP